MSSLMIQAGLHEVDFAAQMATELGLGVTLVANSNPRTDHEGNLEIAAQRFANLTGSMPALDTNYYSGSRRRLGATALSLQWATRQVRLGVPEVVTDAGYIGEGRIDLVGPALQQASDLQQQLGHPVLAMLPMESSILGINGPELLDLIERTDVRIALALGNPGDPLGAQRAVRSLIPLIRTTRVDLRRCDLSAIGALAFGAPSAAIASSASLRHVYPPSKRTGYIPTGIPSVLVPRPLCWRKQDRLNDVAARYPRDDVWICMCSQCAGRGVNWALESEIDVMRHNFFVAAALAHDVVSSPDSAATWFSRCRSAQAYLWEVGSEIAGEWEPQNFLGAWIASEPSRASQ